MSIKLVQTPSGPVSLSDYARGKDGKSAYEVWLETHEGSEEDFFDFLTGPEGPPGQSSADAWTIGEDGYWYRLGVKTDHKAQGEDGAEGKAGADGKDGAEGPAGADGKGWTFGAYIPETGIVEFYSEDDLGFATGDLRGADGKDGKDGNDGTDGAKGADGKDGQDGADGLGWTGGSYNQATGVVSFTSNDGLGFATTDLRGKDGAKGADGADGKGWTGGSYNSSDGKVTFTSTDGLGFATDDLRAAKGADGADGADGAKGDDGLSAYEIWLAEGNSGSESVFLASLKGADGQDGTNGQDGAPGVPGQGVPTGGTAGQVLTKNTSYNYDTKWADPSGGGVTASEVMMVVNHGSTAGTARPTAGAVYWIGTVEPTNAEDGDLWIGG